jgi:hypothetical protein
MIIRLDESIKCCNAIHSSQCHFIPFQSHVVCNRLLSLFDYLCICSLDQNSALYGYDDVPSPFCSLTRLKLLANSSDCWRPHLLLLSYHTFAIYNMYQHTQTLLFTINERGYSFIYSIQQLMQRNERMLCVVFRTTRKRADNNCSTCHTQSDSSRCWVCFIFTLNSSTARIFGWEGKK